jgi:hypothetical protein
MTHPDFPAETAGLTLPQTPPPPAFPAPSTEPTAEALKPTEIRAPRKVLFNLDELENDKSSEPFVFSYQGKDFELLDPKDCDWQDLLVVQEDPRLTLHVLMPEEQRKEFLELKLPMRKFEALLTRWQQHFNQPAPGEEKGSALS